MATTASDPVVAREETDAELFAALAVDQTNALARLYDRHAGLVHGLAMKILRVPAEAEDLTQEIFLRLCTKCDYDPDRGPMSAFLAMQTRSRAIDRVRARTRKTRFVEQWSHAIVPDEPVASPYEALSAAECSGRVRAALAELPEDQRRVLELSYYRGLTQTEIAAELDTPLGTVKSWTRRGLLQLRASLASLLG
jgi:RNA polymerase sigma-70 factor (ECF subfamily)